MFVLFSLIATKHQAPTINHTIKFRKQRTRESNVKKKKLWPLIDSESSDLTESPTTPKKVLCQCPIVDLFFPLINSQVGNVR